ncbi:MULTISPECIES: AraC family transcriptional regulator [unclassified Lysobacter]|uniref:AraC family transcriptional regulator n=1 Tax=unclassified Lysobacter TaxID=2635362 RepID=UPI0006FE74D1|nr:MULTISPECIES: AraC family transcriptional regulator [unclassified Lysobacter]KQZ57803.1 AraC family transcriptional regulator [Lysobacter sp. Root559]KRA74446.1 AraC family transcriptional regulator [Lysobacter sp. Root667]KRC33955.1 AraC family transcriptional regulator [Lysobacter sp. Root76]KRD69289.1 AraC family transcriptional regulator [Lysobacter sp. Root96]
MTDPLAELITLLRPVQVMGKSISGAGQWGVRYAPFGHPGFCVVTDGSCLLQVDGADPLRLEAGDFVFLPATPGFVLSGFEPVEPQHVDPATIAEQGDELRHGSLEGEPDVRMLGGYFVFDSPDTALLVALLPPVIHVRGEDRFGVLVRLVREEAMQTRSGRDLILTRLVEVLLIEALRAAPGDTAPAGLLRGLADERLALSIREMHRDPSRAWTVEQLAKVAALSRSAYFQRFTRAVGMPPMEYLLAWRMAIAKDILDRQDLVIEKVAERVGYSSASTFSTAFTRYVGRSPSGYARERRQVRSCAA